MSELVARVKRCNDCGEIKNCTEFSPASSNRDGRRHDCKPCVTAKVRARQRQRREEMGEEAWLRLQREQTARYRAQGRTNDKVQAAAYREATRKLIAAHRDEFDALYRVERYERGLPVREVSS